MTSKNLRVSAELRALYSDWCLPRRGNANPEIMTNDIWVWMIKDGGWPGRSHAHFGTGERKSPGWCFSRYGQSETTLPDGSIVYIGGEHEDWYDPDFYIYNDVVVKAPDGSISIYGYPPDIFPPTDSHTATLVGDQIFIVGCLGYAEQRDPGTTPVYILDTTSFSIRAFETKGTPPPWLYKHTARLSVGGNTLLFDSGLYKHTTSGRHIENTTMWRLCLLSGVWDRVFDKAWTRWMFSREDDSANDLKAIERLEHAERTGQRGVLAERASEEFEVRNFRPDFELYRHRYRPPIPHKELPRGDYLYGKHRIEIDGVMVRYKEGHNEIIVTVEGDLPETTISALKYYGLEVFSALEEVPYKIWGLGAEDVFHSF